MGWHTPEEARAKVEEWVARPYYQDFTLQYQDKALTLSPGEDLGFDIPVADMVDEAVAASHQYDYWEGFKLWVQDQAEPLDLDVPLRMDFDETAAEALPGRGGRDLRYRAGRADDRRPEH